MNKLATALLVACFFLPRPLHPQQAPAQNRSAYPVRPAPDPAKVDHGKRLFSANCSFCHGANARGGEGGPNLTRSEIVLDDKEGELITPIVQNGVASKGMPKFGLTAGDVADIAAFIHSFPVGGRASRGLLTNPVVGDAAAGKSYFQGPGECTQCHSATGDLAGIGKKYQPIELQGAILTGGLMRSAGGAEQGLAGAKRTTATVRTSNGQTFQGTLDHIDEFTVSLTASDGIPHTFEILGDSPQVTIYNPLSWHNKMMSRWKDSDIHNLTAYLLTLK